jgi:hypothetical protein
LVVAAVALEVSGKRVMEREPAAMEFLRLLTDLR